VEVILRPDPAEHILGLGRHGAQQARASAAELIVQRYDFIERGALSITHLITGAGRDSVRLRAASARKVWRETASGAKADRAQRRRALDQLAAGDVLMVTWLDRLARSTRDLLNIMATIAEKRAGFQSLGDVG
jgi:hypothetical protein